MVINYRHFSSLDFGSVHFSEAFITPVTHKVEAQRGSYEGNTDINTVESNSMQHPSAFKTGPARNETSSLINF